MSDDPTEPLPPRGRSLRILVVEDHADTLRVLARLLDHFGHEISWADGAQSALEIVESKEFDVILSEIGLPDGSGYELIAQAKRRQPVKGVALTGFDKEEDIRRSKEAGFRFPPYQTGRLPRATHGSRAGRFLISIFDLCRGV